MNNLKLVFTLILLSIPISTIAGQAEYDECILKHLKGAKLDMASITINQACKENYRNPGFTPKSRRAYNECLLEHLPGVESIQAAMLITAACKNKNK